MTRRDVMMRGAAVAVFLPAAGCARDAARPGGAEDAYPPLGDFMTVDGLRLHYVDTGEPDEVEAEAADIPTVILVHGANGNLRDFTFSLVDRLKDRFRVIAFDRPGLGYSGRPETGGSDPMVQARILADAADALGVKRAIVAGHSYGGAVATAWGLRRPDQVAGMAVLAGATYPWGGDGGVLYTLGAGPLAPVVGAFARSYVSGARVDKIIAEIFKPNAPPEGYADYIGVELALRPGPFRWNAEDLDDLNGFLTALAPRYGELAMPLEVLHGDADETVFLDVHSRPLARDARNARLTVLPGVGHMPHHVREDEVVAALHRLRIAAFGETPPDAFTVDRTQR